MIIIVLAYIMHLIDHNETDSGMYIVPECIAIENVSKREWRSFGGQA